MPLNWNTTQHQIDLVVIIPVPLQILNHPQTALSIRDSRIHIVLLTLLVNTKTLEVYHPAWTKLRLYWAGDENGRFAVDHAEFLLAIFDHVEFDGDDAGDFDGAAEGDLAIALCGSNVSV